MMNRKLILLISSVIFAFASAVPALAGQWVEDRSGWYYQNDDATFLENCWMWIDGDGDGAAEAYHFNANGYLSVNTTIGGLRVNAKGQVVKKGNNEVLTVKVPKCLVSYVSAQAGEDAGANAGEDAGASAGANAGTSAAANAAYICRAVYQDYLNMNVFETAGRVYTYAITEKKDFYEAKAAVEAGNQGLNQSAAREIGPMTVHGTIRISKSASVLWIDANGHKTNVTIAQYLKDHGANVRIYYPRCDANGYIIIFEDGTWE